MALDKKITDFQEKYPTKAEKEKALSNMSNEEIDDLIGASSNVQAKIFYASFKKSDDGAKK